MKKLLLAAATLAVSGIILAHTPIAAAAKEMTITSSSAAAVEAFKKGRDYSEDIRTPEATEQFKTAINIDPNFALAHAYLGMTTPGGEGLKQLEQAVSLAKDLPEAERTYIDLLLADRRGEEERVRTLWHQLAGLAPDDWRVQTGLGFQLSGERKWDESNAALKKATDLNPNAGSAYNAMGYNYLTMGKNEAAIEAFRKYAAIRPDEPNPHDSLAEALMADGRFSEAETSFRKAAEVSPNFAIAWEGVAQTKFLRGDWAGGREALAKGKEVAPRPVDKLDIESTLAWSQASAGNHSEALQTFEGIEKAAETEGLKGTSVFAALDRAAVLRGMGQYDEALKQANATLKKAEGMNLPGGTMNGVRRFALLLRIDLESKLGRTADAKKTLALIEEEGKKAPANAGVQSMIHFGRGAEAMARKDAKAAAQHFAQCNDQDYYGRLELAMAQEKAGDRAGAEATREKLRTANRRSAFYLYVRSQVAEKAEASAR